MRPGGAYVLCVTTGVSATPAGLMGSAVLRYRPAARSVEVSLPAPTVGDVDFECVAPYRQVRSYRGQRNYCGVWWLETSKRHVTFESWCERDHLILLDFDPEVLIADPMPMVGRPKLAKTLPKALPADSVAALLEALNADQTAAAMRHSARRSPAAQAMRLAAPQRAILFTA
jgi:hypothetical protein